MVAVVAQLKQLLLHMRHLLSEGLTNEPAGLTEHETQVVFQLAMVCGG